MKIGIRFSDNDFTNTFRSVLTIFKEMYLYRGEDFQKLTKEKILEIVLEMAPICYKSFQSNDFDIDNNTREWVTSSRVQIFLNDEVDNYVEKNNGWDNHEFHILDLNQHEPYIYSI